jgi:phage terminase large subunit
MVKVADNPPQVAPYIARGAAAQLLEPIFLVGSGQQAGDEGRVRRGIRLGKRFPELLIEGPAGTGKSRAVCEAIHLLCILFPGIRVLICRQTLSSLRQSVQVTLEEKVWTDGRVKPIPKDASRENRSGYTYAHSKNVVNGKVYEGTSEIVLGGLDKPERTFSTEYDVVWVEEAVEVSRDAWEKLLRVNRNWAMPWQVAICSTNPGSEYHWLYKRTRRDDEKTGKRLMRTLYSRHTDNPCLWDPKRDAWTPDGEDYLVNKLGHMSGATRKRLLDGVWCSEEGQIWPNFDESVHVIPRDALPEMRWAFGAQDWGYGNPGCLQIWGVDKDDNIYRLYVAYHSKQIIDWWAGMIEEAQRLLRREHNIGLLLTVADPAEPDSIDKENQMLAMPQHEGEAFVRKANNDWQTGRDLVDMAMIADPKTKKPAIYWVEGGLMHRPDPDLEARGVPIDDVQEIPAWVFRQVEDGKPLKGREQEDPTRANHGCACTRYAANFKFLRNYQPKQRAKFEEGTMGSLLQHNKVKFTG